MDQFDANQSQDLSKIFLGIKQAIIAIKWSAKLMKDTNPETIANCWRKTAILSNSEAEVDSAADFLEEVSTAELERFQEQIPALNVEDELTAQEYAQPDEEDQVSILTTAPESQLAFPCGLGIVFEITLQHTV